MVYAENLKKINPLKLQQVMACIEVAKKHPKIRKMIIFGSSVTNDCREDSDVDICLEINGSTRGREMFDLVADLCVACDHNCDILKYHKLNDKFKAEIDKKGVIIYELS